ncbi:uncharacterized protein LOC143377894 isoform X2 [Andrena cerasifolii]|uniref:uncharacterized protein LOC143377894 isoform X2 n=1 Tax=Andrena cerasifolii TaxID=2819439 RepID=UPI0040381466
MAADHHLHAMPSEANLCNAFMQDKAKVDMQRPGPTLVDKHGQQRKENRRKLRSSGRNRIFNIVFPQPVRAQRGKVSGKECARKERDREQCARVLLGECRLDLERAVYSPRRLRSLLRRLWASLFIRPA